MVNPESDNDRNNRSDKRERTSDHREQPPEQLLSQQVWDMMRNGFVTATRNTGDWLADDAMDATRYKLEPSTRKSVRSLGLHLQGLANSIDPPPPQSPPDLANDPKRPAWLQAAIRQELQSGKPTSLLPGAREQLRKAGIDLNGNLPLIAVLDSFSGRNGFKLYHGEYVTAVINARDCGLIPDADVMRIDINSAEPHISDEQLKKMGLNEAISVLASSTLEDVSNVIKNLCIEHHDPNMQVLNISQGGGKSAVIQKLPAILNDDAKEVRPWLIQLVGTDAADKWIKITTDEIKPDTADRNECANILLQKLAEAIDKQLANDPKFKSAMDRYQEITKQAAENGVAIIVAAGNNGANSLVSVPKLDLPLSPGFTFNDLAESPHVISVGACQINGTTRTSDDEVAPFSSPGTHEFHPTVVAHGTRVLISNKLDKCPSGTSFSTPVVAGTVALMKKVNPDLTPRDCKTILQQTALKLGGSGIEQQGAGEVDIVAAVLAAKAQYDQKHNTINVPRQQPRPNNPPGIRIL